MPIDFAAAAMTLAQVATPVGRMALEAAQPCINAIQGIPDPLGVFTTVADLSPANLFCRYVLANGDVFAFMQLHRYIMPLLWTLYKLIQTLRNIPWRALYNRYTIPLAVLASLGLATLGIWATDAILNLIWAVVACRYLLPVHAVLLVRAPSSMLQWLTLICGSRWIWTWNTFMTRSAISMLTANSTIAMLVAGAYFYVMAYCTTGILYAGCFADHRRVSALGYCGLVTATIVKSLHLLFYAHSMTLFSVMQLFFLGMALLYGKEACLGQHNYDMPPRLANLILHAFDTFKFVCGGFATTILALYNHYIDAAQQPSVQQGPVMAEPAQVVEVGESENDLPQQQKPLCRRSSRLAIVNPLRARN